jgi:hypothetical protein
MTDSHDRQTETDGQLYGRLKIAVTTVVDELIEERELVPATIRLENWLSQELEKVKSSDPITRKPHVTIARRLNVAAIVSVLLAFYFVSSSWLTETGQVAFAEVQKAINETTSVKLTSRYPSSPFLNCVTYRRKNGDCRSNFEDGLLQVIFANENFMTSFDSKAKTTWKTPLIGGAKTWTLIERILKLEEKSLRPLEPKLIKGVMCIGFEANLLQSDQYPAVVWVNPTTRLPVQIEQSYDNRLLADQNFVMTIEFGSVTDSDLFGNLPTDYRTVDSGPFAPQMPESFARLRLMNLRPGEGIGPVNLGDSVEQIVKFFGQQDRAVYHYKDKIIYEQRVDELPDRTELVFEKFGLTFLIDSQSRLQRVKVESMVIGRNDFSSVFAIMDQCRVGSEWSDALAYLGLPVRTEGSEKDFLAFYDKKGIEFSILNNRIQSIIVHRKE